MLGFTNCTNLSEITIPNSVKLIGTGAFYGCTGLTKVNISEGVETIGYRAFYGCSQLTEVTIPNSATKLWGGIFEDCTGLTKVTFPENVDGTTNDGISNYLFRNCSSLTEVSLPNGFKILRNTFDGCSNLKNVTIPNSVTSIESNVFRGCIGLTSITIPNSVTSIGSSAFSGCTGLTSVTIPNSVTSIESKAFIDCTGLKEVINKSDLNITQGSTANGYVAYYADIVYNGDKTVIGDFIFSDRDKTLVKYTGNGGAITLPENFNGDNYIIKDNVFSGNSNLTSVTIPSSVTNIGASAFAGCSGLTEIICEGETPAGSNTIFGEGGEAGKIYVKALLKVPSQWFKLYKVTEPWCRFDMTASDFDMVVIPYENKAVFTWTPITGAEAYELTVIEKETGEALCSLNFDAYGRLRGLVLRNDSEKTYVGGYDFTVTSLRGDVEYDYTMEVKDISDNVIESMSGTFRTSDGVATAAPEAEESIVETARYDINGRPLTAPTKGVNIVKYSDGSFEKEFVR